MQLELGNALIRNGNWGSGVAVLRTVNSQESAGIRAVALLLQSGLRLVQVGRRRGREGADPGRQGARCRNGRDQPLDQLEAALDRPVRKAGTGARRPAGDPPSPDAREAAVQSADVPRAASGGGRHVGEHGVRKDRPPACADRGRGEDLRDSRPGQCPYREWQRWIDSNCNAACRRTLRWCGSSTSPFPARPASRVWCGRWRSSNCASLLHRQDACTPHHTKSLAQFDPETSYEETSNAGQVEQVCRL